MNDAKEWGTSSVTGSVLMITTPETQYPEDPYDISVYVDYRSATYPSEFVAGQVVEVTNDDPVAIDNTYVFDFYDE